MRAACVTRVAVASWLLLLGALPRAGAQEPARSALSIVSAAPNQEVATLAEANEIRIVFSEPMVSLGRIPSTVQAPFVRIEPAISGSFRWSGTTILIFTPDPKPPLPYATRFEVTVDTTATAVSGRRLAQPFRFAFTTPTVRLLRTDTYRRNGRADAPLVVLLRFNQPVRPADVAAHLTARFEPYAWPAPHLGPEARARLAAVDPQSAARFDAKVAATRAATQATAPVSLKLTNEWDRKRYKPGRDLVVFETHTPVPSSSHVEIALDTKLPSPAGPATPPSRQEYTIQAEPAFFVDGFRCAKGCDPDRWNPVWLRTRVEADAFGRAVTVRNVSAAVPGEIVAPSAPAARRRSPYDDGAYLTLEDAGHAQPPASTYEVAIDGGLTSVDGQTLGYTWLGTVENSHRAAFTSFGDGHGVWEADGGTLLPFYARNLTSVKQWVAPVGPDDLMPIVQSLSPHFGKPPDVSPTMRTLPVTPDRVQSHGLEVKAVLGNRATGLLWAAVENGAPIARSEPVRQSLRASVIQVTNLGVNVKFSAHNALVLVTRLDDAAPVEGARVSIVMADNSVYWTGRTDAEGVALAPGIPSHQAQPSDEGWPRMRFLVLAEKDGDVAYVGSDWNEGIEPWAFGTWSNPEEADPMLRGSVFSDRGVYRPGEEVHFKAILRQNTPTGVRLLRQGTPVLVTLRDGRARLVDERTITVNGWSSTEWTVTLPGDATLGTYSVRAILEADRPKPRAPQELRPWETPGPAADEHVSYARAVHGSLLVAAYRRPDFRVDVTLRSDDALAGGTLQGRVSARYLFGAAMGPRPVTWVLSRAPVFTAPAAVTGQFPSDRWQFVGWPDDRERIAGGEVRRAETTLSKTGDLPLELSTPPSSGVPFMYTLEGDIEDLSRQHIANRAGVLVHPAPWYVGVRSPGYFIDQKAGLKTEIVAVAPDGRVVAGIPVEIQLTRIQWHSVRRAEGNGFYTWETERKEIAAGSWTVTTAGSPVAFETALPSGGYFVLKATGRGEGGRFAVTRTSFYALGDGYTAWARHDHNRIDLVAERSTYEPGDTARIIVQSPWEGATALVTTEREGVRYHRRFTLTSTQQTVTVPVTEIDIPNLFVSVLLVKGRSAPAAGGATSGAETDTSDPGKPAFRLGYVELKVEDAGKRLAVSVRADREEYRPAKTARVALEVRDHQGRGAPSEVTLWAVDYGVLSLTAYRTPDVLGSVYVRKTLQVMNADNRQRIISRRVLTPKGETDGGGGGVDGGADMLRRDFRVLAFWVGSVVTDAYGKGAVEVTLPESLTTYRIMAVAGDRSSRFGAGDSEVRINKPLTLKPAFPRFLALGDRAHLGAVVTSQLASSADARVTVASLDPGVLEIRGGDQAVALEAGASAEVRFDAVARAVGTARVRVTVAAGGETDAFEDTIPVRLLVSPETVAAYGQAGAAVPTARERLTLPSKVVPGVGGLQLELSSTAMVGLGEGARYLVEYPYACAEQKGSRALAMLLAADLGDAFSLPGIEPAKLRPIAQQAMKDLERFQCENGGFAYWPGGCPFTSPYLTAYLLHVFETAADLKHQVDRGVRQRAYAYLERELAAPPPTNEGWWPAYTAWQAFAVKVLVDGGRNQDSNLTRLYGYRDRMPVFGLAHLHDALLARRSDTQGQGDERLDELRRRIVNAILPEGGSAHVEELADPYLLWFWNSNVRSTAIVLDTLVRAGDETAPIREIVRWLMAAREDGRWGNTQENAWAMQALVAYYRRYEAEAPDFRATVALGPADLAQHSFKGRSTAAATTMVPMETLVSHGEASETLPLVFSRTGTGTLFYSARLRYAADEVFQEGLDNGIRIERRYEPFVENGSRPAATSFKAGDLVRVTLTFHLTKERRFLAATDPLPAGFEAVESWFATTAAAIKAERRQDPDVEQDWLSQWRRGGFDHVERYDDRVQLFATRLSEGTHELSYVARATTAGTFTTAPARAEEMYEPEVFGRTATATIEVRP